jgi:hypothetical protein
MRLNTGVGSGGNRPSTRSLDEFLGDPFCRAFAGALVEDLPQIIDEVVRVVVAEDHFYAELGEPPIARLREDVEDNLGHIVRGFAGLEPLDFDRARAVAERAAAGGVPLAAVLHVYRLGAQVIWGHVVHDGSWRRREPEVDLVLRGGLVVWKLCDAFSKVITEVYDDTAAERFRRSEQERTLLVDALLEGRTQDLPRMADVARILDLPELGELVVVVAENPEAGAAGLPDIESAMAAERIPCAWRLRSQRHIGIVVTGPTRPGLSLDGVCGLLAKHARARVGVSPIYGELGDTARHVALADLALACLPAASIDVALFDDHPIDALVARSPELSERVVRLVLEPVLRLGDEADALLDTLETWIASGGSTTVTAGLLFCHRNTVRNRLQRIETLTGRLLSDPNAVAELCLAVRALALAPHLRTSDRP